MKITMIYYLFTLILIVSINNINATNIIYKEQENDKLTNDIVYKTSENGEIYSEYLSIAIKENNKWIKGPIVHSSNLMLGSKIWWMDNNGIQYVTEIGHYNVTSEFTDCTSKYRVPIYENCKSIHCCGAGCC